MKKLTLLMFSILVAFAANAVDYYLTGSATPSGWTKQDAMKFTAGTDGTYTLSCTGTFTGEVKINDGGWSNKNNTYGGVSDVTMKPGDTVNLTTGDASKNITLSGVKNPVFTFNPTAKTLALAGQTETVNYKYCIHGQLKDGSTWANTELTEENGKWVVKNLETKKASFGIRQYVTDINTGTAWINADGTADITVGTAMKCKKDGTNFNIAAGTYTYTFDPVAMTLLVTGEGQGGEDPVTPPTPETNQSFELHGQLTGNANWESVKLTANGDWYEYTGDLVAGAFGIRKYSTSNWTGSSEWIGGNAKVTEADTEYSFSSGDNSSSTLVGKYTVAYNPTTSKIKFVPFSGEIVETITYVLRGNINGDWADFDMTEQTNGNWDLTVEDPDGEFGIKKCANGAQKVWYAAPTAAAAPITGAGEYTAGDLGTTNWSMSLTGKYTLSFDPENLKLNVSKAETGVEGVAVEAGKAVYYNLQGVRVETPANGIYVRVANGKATKVVVK